MFLCVWNVSSGFRDRIAAIYVKRTEDPSKGAVVFDLIPPLNSSGNIFTVFEISIAQPNFICCHLLDHEGGQPESSCKIFP